MATEPTLPVIQKSESIPASGDYDRLVEEGLERISQYSGQLWNNYNNGDPGVTILQTLCYALTELSYKAHLPIEDILTDENGKIIYQDRFVKPQDILPTHPVTEIDHQKNILDETLEIKQIYFNLRPGQSILNTFQPYVELKPSYVKQSSDEAFTCPLLAKVDYLLQGQENLGQLFLPTHILEALQLRLSGKIYLQPTVEVEEFVAQLFFLLNNYLSPYPIFRSYDALLAAGMTNDEIFEGPLLKNGFLSDALFVVKKEELSAQEMMTLINHMMEVETVSAITFLNAAGAPELSLSIAYDQAPYFDLDDLLRVDSELQYIQNGRCVKQISKSKVQYYLKNILPGPQPKVDFDRYLPKGTYQGIRDYYSIQHHFPEIYKLNNSSYLKHAGPIRSAKIKQLKAYLVLFEQIMANYLAQLSQVGELFSFNSGRTVYQLAGKTYYFQDLYDVPGIQELLRDVKGYSNQYNEQSPYEDWKAYQRDYLNPYRQQLMAAMESPNINLDRKLSVLKHLLARFGTVHTGAYLSFNNPGYGDNRTAEVEQISATLKQFPLLSANRSRTYFSEGIVPEPFSCYSDLPKEEQPADPNKFYPNPFYAGFELLAGNELNLNSYYEGIEEMFGQSLEKEGDNLVVLYFDGMAYRQLFPETGRIVPDPISTPPPKGWIKIYQNERLLLSFLFGDIDQDSLSIEEVEMNFGPYLEILSQLRLQCQGFVFIDHIQLLKELYFSWEVFAEDESSLHRSPFLSLAQLEQFVSLINSESDLMFVEADGIFSIEVVNGSDRALIYEGTVLETAKEIESVLTEWRSGNKDRIRLLAHNEDWETLPIDFSFFNNKVSVYFPDWIPLLQEETYNAFLNKKLRAITPLNVHLLTPQYLPREEMETLLKAFALWMTQLRDRMPRECPELISPVSPTNAIADTGAWTILNTIISQHERS